MVRRVGVLLSGCGRYDGSEVQETVLLTLALRRRGLRPVFVAPDDPQSDVVDHASGNVVSEAAPRGILGESARLTRGVIRAAHELTAEELDAIVIPGGTGVVKNLCVSDGSLGGGALRDDVRRLLEGLRARDAPIAALGLGEVVLARLHDRPLRSDPMTADPTEVLADAPTGTLFTPGFVATDEITEVARGIERLVDELAARLGTGSGNETTP